MKSLLVHLPPHYRPPTAYPPAVTGLRGHPPQHRKVVPVISGAPGSGVSGSGGRSIYFCLGHEISSKDQLPLLLGVLESFDHDHKKSPQFTFPHSPYLSKQKMNLCQLHKIKSWRFYSHEFCEVIMEKAFLLMGLIPLNEFLHNNQRLYFIVILKRAERPQPSQPPLPPPPPPQIRFWPSPKGSLDLHHRVSYYLETANEGGELVTHTRVKKCSVLFSEWLSWRNGIFTTV